MAQTIQQALETFDRAEHGKVISQGEEIRKIIISKFPADGWPSMTLEQYALGHEDAAESYCRWLEFRSTELGSISGGNATKLVIYKHREKRGWYFPSTFETEQTAWEALRLSVATMLERARESRWGDLQELMPFQYGAALWLKTLFVYFQAEILPVYSTAHLASFRYRLSSVSPKISRKLGAVALNRTLLQELRATPGLQGFSAEELGRFLYHWDDPRDATSVYKIAPGEDAKLWPECLAGGYIAVGWPLVGDLSAYENFADFQERFKAAYLPRYADSPAGKATVTRKAKEVWSLTKVEPGDLVLANQGMSRILAVGEVQDPPYEWGGEANAHPHRIRVNWDTSQARAIPAQPKWAFATVAPVLVEQVRASHGGRPGRGTRRGSCQTAHASGIRQEAGAARGAARRA